MRRRCAPCTASGEPQDKPQIVSRVGIWARHAAHWSVLKMSAQAKTNLPHRKQQITSGGRQGAHVREPASKQLGEGSGGGDGRTCRRRDAEAAVVAGSGPPPPAPRRRRVAAPVARIPHSGAAPRTRPGPRRTGLRRGLQGMKSFGWISDCYGSESCLVGSAQTWSRTLGAGYVGHAAPGQAPSPATQV